ncbi:hypothetical protein FRC08_018812 [Ceratobasidium sp. 394]|nr:hypothetical protein FRC08_018812 [Ceratobasidium sp. 394]
MFSTDETYIAKIQLFEGIIEVAPKGSGSLDGKAVVEMLIAAVKSGELSLKLRKR